MQIDMDRKSVIFFLAAILALVHFGESDMCYTCDYSIIAGVTVGDKRCADPFDVNSGVANKTCDPEFGCTKLSTTSDAVETWGRGCNTVSRCINTCEGEGGATVCQHCCTGDYCNGVGTVGVSFLAMIFGILLAVFASRSWY